MWEMVARSHNSNKDFSGTSSSENILRWLSESFHFWKWDLRYFSKPEVISRLVHNFLFHEDILFWSGSLFKCWAKNYIFWESLSDEVTNPSYLLHPSNNKVLTRRDLFMSFHKAVLVLIYSISSITPIPPNLSVPQLPSIPLFSFHQFYHIY